MDLGDLNKTAAELFAPAIKQEKMMCDQIYNNWTKTGNTPDCNIPREDMKESIAAGIEPEILRIEENMAAAGFGKRQAPAWWLDQMLNSGLTLSVEKYRNYAAKLPLPIYLSDEARNVLEGLTQTQQREVVNCYRHELKTLAASSLNQTFAVYRRIAMELVNYSKSPVGQSQGISEKQISHQERTMTRVTEEFDRLCNTPGWPTEFSVEKLDQQAETKFAGPDSPSQLAAKIVERAATFSLDVANKTEYLFQVPELKRAEQVKIAEQCIKKISRQGP